MSFYYTIWSSDGYKKFWGQSNKERDESSWCQTMMHPLRLVGHSTERLHTLQCVFNIRVIHHSIWSEVANYVLTYHKLKALLLFLNWNQLCCFLCWHFVFQTHVRMTNIHVWNHLRSGCGTKVWHLWGGEGKAYKWPNLLSCAVTVSTIALYSDGPRFNSQQTDQLAWLEFFVISLRPHLSTCWATTTTRPGTLSSLSFIIPNRSVFKSTLEHWVTN
jgi:hypothetical protein